MAARVTTSVVDFAALAGKIPSNQLGSFNALRGKVRRCVTSSRLNIVCVLKVEKHLRNVSALPAALPNIDFAAYNKVRQRESFVWSDTSYSLGERPRHGGGIREEIQSSAGSLSLRPGRTAG